MALRDLVVLDDPTLRSMATDQRFLKDFPFLASLAIRQAGSCGRCNRRRNSTSEAAVNTDAVKRMINGLPLDKKKKLLQLLNAKQIRIRYRDGNQTVVKTIKTA